MTVADIIAERDNMIERAETFARQDAERTEKAVACIEVKQPFYSLGSGPSSSDWSCSYCHRYYSECVARCPKCLRSREDAR